MGVRRNRSIPPTLESFEPAPRSLPLSEIDPAHLAAPPQAAMHLIAARRNRKPDRCTYDVHPTASQKLPLPPGSETSPPFFAAFFAAYSAGPDPTHVFFAGPLNCGPAGKPIKKRQGGIRFMTRPAPPPSLFHLAVMSDFNGNAAMKPISHGSTPQPIPMARIPGISQRVSRSLLTR